MFMSKTVMAVVILAALAPLSAQAKWQNIHQAHATAILVAPGAVASQAPSPGRSSGGTMTLETVNPAPQYSSQGDWQTANSDKH